jgi:hypothetical protein
VGYLLTGVWTFAGATLRSSSFEDWLAWPGIVIVSLLSCRDAHDAVHDTT